MKPRKVNMPPLADLIAGSRSTRRTGGLAALLPLAAPPPPPPPPPPPQVAARRTPRPISLRAASTGEQVQRSIARQSDFCACRRRKRRDRAKCDYCLFHDPLDSRYAPPGGA